MSVYYIDSLSGSDDNPGLDILKPRESFSGLVPLPGDTVLFRRGTEYRGGIRSPSGEAGAPITYGAYGEGEPPVFLGSVDCSDSWMWEDCGGSVYRLRRTLENEVCNIVFDRRFCGELVWEKEKLDSQGKFYCDTYGTQGKPGKKTELFMYSEKNPAGIYGGIEVCVFGGRRLLSGKRHIRFEGLNLMCSGVHGYAETAPEDVIIRDCRFEFIGGCVWSAQRRIRFGNGVEFWNGARDCSVIDCGFYEIYDSCVTTQGSVDMTVPENIVFSGNTFENYGMAALELRDKTGINMAFEYNVCSGAGHGFSMAGEGIPRNSEIYPEPMGHHIFAWRIEEPTPGGEVRIRSNIFKGVPAGERAYLRVPDAVKAQLRFESNIER